MKTLVFYDGNCGFCRWSVSLALHLDREGRLDAVPLQTPGVLAQHGISRAAAEKALHVVTPEGAVYRAGDAVRAILSVLPWFRPMRFLWRVPGFPWLADRLYYLVADNRGFLSSGLALVGVDVARCGVRGV